MGGTEPIAMPIEDLLKQLEALTSQTPYGKVHLTLSQSNGMTTATALERVYPERFNHDNAQAQSYISRLVRGHMDTHTSGLVTLELLYKDGDLLVVTEHTLARNEK